MQGTIRYRYGQAASKFKSEVSSILRWNHDLTIDEICKKLDYTYGTPFYKGGDLKSKVKDAVEHTKGITFSTKIIPCGDSLIGAKKVKVYTFREGRYLR